MKHLLITLALILSLAPFSYASGDHDDEHGHEEGHAEEGAGFEVSPEGIKNFGLTYVKISGKSPWTLPKTAILQSGQESNLYRLRKGHFQRIDFKQNSEAKDSVKVSSHDLESGDEVVVTGVGYLRAAEIMATEGAPEGHSH